MQWSKRIQIAFSLKVNKKNFAEKVFGDFGDENLRTCERASATKDEGSLFGLHNSWDRSSDLCSTYREIRYTMSWKMDPEAAEPSGTNHFRIIKF